MPSETRSRVLCVDDDADACELLRVLLKESQIDATCVQSAAEAWPIIKAKPFDLYMLDGWLPQLDGFEFCRQLREFDADIPILFYSGAAYDADKQRGIAAGANAYVVKPDFERLTDTLLDLLAKAKPKNVALRQVVIERRPNEGWFSGPLFGVETASD